MFRRTKLYVLRNIHRPSLGINNAFAKAASKIRDEAEKSGLAFAALSAKRARSWTWHYGT